MQVSFGAVDAVIFIHPVAECFRASFRWHQMVGRIVIKTMFNGVGVAPVLKCGKEGGLGGDDDAIG